MGDVWEQAALIFYYDFDVSEELYWIRSSPLRQAYVLMENKTAKINSIQRSDIYSPVAPAISIPMGLTE